MKTTKEMKQAIKDKYEAIPDMEVSTGVYLKTIGRKFITTVNIWDSATTERQPIAEFYNYHIGQGLK